LADCRWHGWSEGKRQNFLLNLHLYVYRIENNFYIIGSFGDIVRQSALGTAHIDSAGLEFLPDATNHKHGRTVPTRSARQRPSRRRP
jgi:hypothetical protein